MIRRGFTIVELIITITIMGILLTLAVVNVNTTQLKSRDNERKADVEAIATALESFYSVGGNNPLGLGRYPSTGLTSPGTGNIVLNLRDVDLKSFTAPGVASSDLTFIPSTNVGTDKSIQTTVNVQPQPTIGQYVYQPIKTDGGVCTSGYVDCRKYNIFYRLEVDNAVYKITSKNQ